MNQIHVLDRVVAVVVVDVVLLRRRQYRMFHPGYYCC